MIPLPTTTVTIERPGADTDQFDTPTWTVVATGVQAHIGSPGGQENRDGGARSDETGRLVCNPTAILARDRVTDESTGQVWGVEWVQQRGPFLAHTVAQLTRAVGVARG